MMGRPGPPQGMGPGAIMGPGYGPPGGPPGGPPSEKATPQCCIDGGPCGITHLCFEPEGSISYENWDYVGEGKGQYSQMQVLSYAGEGRGTHNKEVERADPGKYMKW